MVNVNEIGNLEIKVWQFAQVLSLGLEDIVSDLFSSFACYFDSKGLGEFDFAVEELEKACWRFEKLARSSDSSNGHELLREFWQLQYLHLYSCAWNVVQLQEFLTFLDKRFANQNYFHGVYHFAYENGLMQESEH